MARMVVTDPGRGVGNVVMVTSSAVSVVSWIGQVARRSPRTWRQGPVVVARGMGPPMPPRALGTGAVSRRCPRAGVTAELRTSHGSARAVEPSWPTGATPRRAMRGKSRTTLPSPRLGPRGPRSVGVVKDADGGHDVVVDEVGVQ